MNFEDELDLILDEIDDRAVGEINRPVEQLYRDKAKQSLKQLIAKTIGEDDKPKIDFDDGDYEWCTVCGSITWEGDDGTSWCNCRAKNSWRKSLKKDFNL